MVGRLSKDIPERRVRLCVAALLIVIGVGVRAWRIGGDPLWLDEAYSAFAASKDFAFLWQVVPHYETHPPFYYTLLWLWERPFGDSLLALRALGLLAGLATIALAGPIGLAAARLLGWEEPGRGRLALAMLALACLSIPLVEMSREVRPYPLMILVYASATWTLLAIARRRRDGGPLWGRAYAAYLALLALLLWLHNLGALWGTAMALALLVAARLGSFTRRDWAWLIGGHVAVGLAYLPAFAMLLDQAPTWVASTWLGFTFESLWMHLLVLYAVPGWQALAAAVLAVLALAGLWREREGRRLAAMLLILALVPVLLSVGITLAIAPVFITRTMTPVAVPTLLLLGIGATIARKRLAWLGLAALAMLVTNMLAVDLQARTGGPMQDWYGTVAWLQKRFRPGDLILAYPNEGALPMQRALRDRGLPWPVKAIPAEVPAFGERGWHPTGSRGVISVPRARLREIARSPEVARVETLWLLRLGAPTYDPGDMFLQELRPGRHLVRRWIDGPIDIIGLRRDQTFLVTPGVTRDSASSHARDKRIPGSRPG